MADGEGTTQGDQDILPPDDPMKDTLEGKDDDEEDEGDEENEE